MALSAEESTEPRGVGWSVESLRPISAHGRQKPIATLPGRQGVHEATGAQDDQTCVVDWPGRELAEKPHGL